MKFIEMWMLKINKWILQTILSIDSKNMRDKLKNEEEERARKEKEMADKLKEAASASENEILTLHKRMAAENAKRIDEINDLR